MYSLVIKGGENDVIEACAERDLVRVGPPTILKTDAVQKVVDEGDTLRKLQRWFNEPMSLVEREGFPPGSLLYFSEV